jgi:hypothetical protein
VRFSKKSPVLFTGNSQGTVDVYRLIGLEHVQVSDEAQIQRIMLAIQKDDFNDAKAEKKEEEVEAE